MIFIEGIDICLIIKFDHSYKYARATLRLRSEPFFVCNHFLLNSNITHNPLQ